MTNTEFKNVQFFSLKTGAIELIMINQILKSLPGRNKVFQEKFHDYIFSF